MPACAQGCAESVPSLSLERQAATTVTGLADGAAGGFTQSMCVITWLALSGTSGVVRKQPGSAVPPTFTWATMYSVDVPSVWSLVGPSFMGLRRLRLAGAAFSFVFGGCSFLPGFVSPGFSPNPGF